MMTNAVPMQNPSSAWLVVMGLGAPLLALAALCFYAVATAPPSVDVGGIVNFFAAMVGLGAGLGGLTLVLIGVSIRPSQTSH
jgi:hypothetical protein